MRVVQRLAMGVLAAALSMTGVAAAAPAAAAAPGPVADSSQLRVGQTRTFTETVYVETGSAAAGRTPMLIVVTESVEEAPTFGVAATECWIHRRNLTSKSLGVTQHTWQHRVRWCFNGSAKVDVTENTSANVGVGMGWNWRGAGNKWISNPSSSAYRVYAQGHYELCYTICIQNNYPSHRADYKANGVIANQVDVYR
ncbi:hypothetical protein [Solwaraspora sp. WMMA2065]|uniref:hypothetical protein n=1 Tax=Solwaraspora sp. WMMA2065 TaxID=3015166 RepID=UPI00259B9305|nr:hypothetical protein [Solwaraspora sp. WMMA2065]WJK37483.1 hypothetical protein O7610_14690 [Solwaraspora sp. WMMA2065]